MCWKKIFIVLIRIWFIREKFFEKMYREDDLKLENFYKNMKGEMMVVYLIFLLFRGKCRI